MAKMNRNAAPALERLLTRDCRMRPFKRPKRGMAPNRYGCNPAAVDPAGSACAWRALLRKGTRRCCRRSRAVRLGVNLRGGRFASHDGKHLACDIAGASFGGEKHI